MFSSVRVFAAAVAFVALSAQSAPDRYAEGQVWQYKTRVGDEGSLLKIQRIENAPTESKIDKIYHISVVGIRLRTQNIVPMLPHAPVSRETLDASVTKLSTSDRSFPPADPGIAEWRHAKGGVYTISVAEIIEALDRTLAARGGSNAD